MKLIHKTIIAWIVLAAAVTVTVIGMKYLYLSLSSADWGSAKGRILNIHIRSEKSTSTKRYKPEVLYTYTYLGKKYSGSRIRFGLSLGTLEIAQQEIQKFTEGQVVEVFVNPQNANESVLEKGGSPLFLFAMVLGLLTIFLAVNIIRKHNSKSG